MGSLILKGNLNLTGNLTLKDTVLVDCREEGLKMALVELIAPNVEPHSSAAPPVIMPPLPAKPADAGIKVWIINSFNKTVKAGAKAIATRGIAMQGGLRDDAPGLPTWPGMVLPSTGNPPGGVTIDMVAVNVVGDKAIIFPSGMSVSLNNSGQS